MPSELEARLALARDLCRNGEEVDEARAKRIAWLPLMDVALGGSDGMDIAAARDWSRAA